MTLTINAAEMPRSFTAVWGQVSHGEMDCVIEENGCPMAWLIPLNPSPEAQRKARKQAIEFLQRPRANELTEEEANAVAEEAIQAFREGRELK